MSSGAHPYRFGFVLSTALGNLTRYQNLRKYAERDTEVECTWAPVKQFIGPGEYDPFKKYPQFLRNRAIVLYQSRSVLTNLGRLDAVMIHMHEANVLMSLRSYFVELPLRIASGDGAPAIDPVTYPLHPVERAKPAWRRRARLSLEIWLAKRADLHIPFSRWAADLTMQAAGLPPSRVIPIHTGLDLELWKHRPRSASADNKRVRVLFCGSDFVAKGGIQLLEAYVRELSGRIELHLVTKTAPRELPNGVHVYDNLSPNDQRLIDLYQHSDMLVHPTHADLSSWVVLEAMACGLPVVATRMGGIQDLVEEGKTGIFVPVRDSGSLARAIRSLVDSPYLRVAMGREARLRVEQSFNAEVNVPKILSLMKSVVDKRRCSRSEHRQTFSG